MILIKEAEPTSINNVIRQLVTLESKSAKIDENHSLWLHSKTNYMCNHLVTSQKTKETLQCHTGLLDSSILFLLVLRNLFDNIFVCWIIYSCASCFYSSASFFFSCFISACQTLLCRTISPCLFSLSNRFVDDISNRILLSKITTPKKEASL